jgi:hypothetical protein
MSSKFASNSPISSGRRLSPEGPRPITKMKAYKFRKVLPGLHFIMAYCAILEAAPVPPHPPMRPDPRATRPQRSLPQRMCIAPIASGSDGRTGWPRRHQTEGHSRAWRVEIHATRERARIPASVANKYQSVLFCAPWRRYALAYIGEASLLQQDRRCCCGDFEGERGSCLHGRPYARAC